MSFRLEYCASPPRNALQSRYQPSLSVMHLFINQEDKLGYVLSGQNMFLYLVHDKVLKLLAIQITSPASWKAHD
jgi:hypothetical protein